MAVEREREERTGRFTWVARGDESLVFEGFEIYAGSFWFVYALIL